MNMSEIFMNINRPQTGTSSSRMSQMAAQKLRHLSVEASYVKCSEPSQEAAGGGGGWLKSGWFLMYQVAENRISHFVCPGGVLGGGGLSTQGSMLPWLWNQSLWTAHSLEIQPCMVWTSWYTLWVTQKIKTCFLKFYHSWSILAGDVQTDIETMRFPCCNSRESPLLTSLGKTLFKLGRSTKNIYCVRTEKG